MNSVPMTNHELARQLHEAWITRRPLATIHDPVQFLQTELEAADDTLVVVEEVDRVLTTRLADLMITEKTIHVHGFSRSARTQARAARTAGGWCGDSVKECGASTAGASRVLAQDRRMMCLGERAEGAGTFAEARIKPYQLPIRGDARQIDVAYRNYYEETASGRLACIAHRAVEFVAREVK